MEGEHKVATVTGAEATKLVEEKSLRSRKKDTSRPRDSTGEVDRRLVSLERAVFDISESIVKVDTAMEKLESELPNEVLEKVNNVIDAVLQENSDLKDLIRTQTRRGDALEEMVAAMRREIDELRGELATTRTVPGGAAEAVRMDVPKPGVFRGQRSAKEVDNFLWTLEQHFRMSGITNDAVRVGAAAMYLQDMALVWWRRRSDDHRRGGAAVTTWVEFQREFRKQFYPECSRDEARSKLRRLTQRGNIRDYVREFSELMLLVPDMGEGESLFCFKDGLKPWAKIELERRGVRDVATAMAIAESLTDLRGGDHHYESGSDSSNENGGEESLVDDKFVGSSSTGNKNRSSKGKQQGDNKKGRKFSGCFICNGPHFAYECAEKKKLNALLRSEDDDANPNEGQLRIGALRLSKD